MLQEFHSIGMLKLKEGIVKLNSTFADKVKYLKLTVLVAFILSMDTVTAIIKGIIHLQGSFKLCDKP